MPHVCTACDSANTLGAAAASACTDCFTASIAGVGIPLVPLAIAIAASVLITMFARRLPRRQLKTSKI